MARHASGLNILAVGLMSWLVGGSAAAQLSPDTAQIKTVPLRNGLYALFGAGGNIGLSIGDDGAYIVDTQFAQMTGKIEAAVKALTDKPIRYVIDTHWHFDHTGGNENLGREGKIIIAHENTRNRMSKDGVIAAMNIKQPASPAIALPAITFADTSDLRLNGMTAHMFYVPNAHTDTDIVVHFREADVIHTGDVYVTGVYPFLDTSSGGSLRGEIAALKRIIALCGPNTIVIPGHGEISNGARVKESLAMLEEMERRITNAIAGGKTLAQVLDDNPSADFDAKWAPRPDQGKVFVTRAYEDLARFVARGKVKS